MLSLMLLAIPTVMSSMAIADTDPDQSVRMANNGEFIANHYPPKALKAGEQGKVGFRLTIEPDGSLGTCDIVESSGSKTLDNETCELILRYARLQPVRNSEGRAVRAVQSGFINWKLPKGVARAASPAPTSKVADAERIICKRTARTGSLVSRSKQCMTARQWAEAARIARNTADEIIGKGHREDEEALGGRSCTMPSGVSC